MFRQRGKNLYNTVKHKEQKIFLWHIILFISTSFQVSCWAVQLYLSSVICLSTVLSSIYPHQSSSIILLPTLSVISINHLYLSQSIYHLLSIILSSSKYQSSVTTTNLPVICHIYLLSIYLLCDILIDGTCSPPHTHTQIILISIYSLSCFFSCKHMKNIFLQLPQQHFQKHPPIILFHKSMQMC